MRDHTALTTLSLATITMRPGHLRDAHNIHQAVARAATGGRILWASPTPTTLLVQAEHIRWATIRGALSAHTIDVTAAHAAFTAGQTVRFALIANPTSAVGKRRPDGSLSLRAGRRALPQADRPGWLARKLAGALTITALTDQPLPAATGRRRDARVTLDRHLFTGTATLLDPAALADLTAGGVGAGKGYGCGLLLVRAAS